MERRGYDYADFKARLKVYQQGKRRAPDTFRKTNSNLGTLMPEGDYTNFISKIDNSLPYEEYSEAYLNGLVKLLGEMITNVLDGEYAEATKNNMCSTARMILIVHGLKDYLKQEPFNRKTGEIKRTLIPIWDDEYKILIDMKTKKLAELRDKTIYILMRQTGSKPSELLRLSYKHFNFLEQKITLINRNQKTRKVHFNAETLNQINNYLKRIPPRGPLFLNTHEKEETITARHMRRRFKKNMAKTKITPERQGALGVKQREISKERQEILTLESLRYAFSKQYINDYKKGHQQEDLTLSKKSEEELRKQVAETLGVMDPRAKEFIALLG